MRLTFEPSKHASESLGGFRYTVICGFTEGDRTRFVAERAKRFGVLLDKPAVRKPGWIRCDDSTANCVALGEGLMVSGFEGFCEAGASWQCVPGLEPWNEEKGWSPGTRREEITGSKRTTKLGQHKAGPLRIR